MTGMGRVPAVPWPTAYVVDAAEAGIQRFDLDDRKRSIWTIEKNSRPAPI